MSKVIGERRAELAREEVDIEDGHEASTGISNNNRKFLLNSNFDRI